MKGFPLPILQTMHIFGLYWFVNIIVNVGMFVLSGTFSQWYWTQRDDFKDLAKNPVCLSKLIFYATVQLSGTLSRWHKADGSDICTDKRRFIM